jgi:hypothetical protein
MIQLVATVCLIAQPTVCRDETIATAANVAPFQCLMGAQIELAKWEVANAKWRVAGWKCARVGTMART